MARRTIVEYPHPVLKTRCSEVTAFDADLAALLDDMRETMVDADGLGLAANQVGVALRAFTMWVPGSDGEAESGELLELVNPEVVGRRGDIRFEEGCLSFPGLSETVLRAAAVDVRFRDRHGEAHTRALDGVAAVCVQHELDHLDGITFLDRLSPLKRRLALRAYGRAQASRAFEREEEQRAAVRGR